MLQLNAGGFPFSKSWTPFDAAAFGGSARVLSSEASDWSFEWGAWHKEAQGEVIADTCPAVVPPDATGWGLLYVQRYNRLDLPDVRKGFVDDYRDQTVEFYACLFDPTNSQCAGDVRATLLDAAAQLDDDPNYRVFFHEGICHVEEVGDGNTVANGSDPSCDFDVVPADWTPSSGTLPASGMVQNGVRFSDWMNALFSEDGRYTNPITNITTTFDNVE
jgi:hypothetical protein